MIQNVPLPLQLFAGASPCAGGVPGACEVPLFSDIDTLIVTILLSVMLASSTIFILGHVANKLSKRFDSHAISSIFIVLFAASALPVAFVLLIATVSRALRESPSAVWYKYMAVILNSSHDYVVLFFLALIVASAFIGYILFTGQNHPRTAKLMPRSAAVTFVIITIGFIAFVELPGRETVLDQTQRAAEKCRIEEKSFLNNIASCEY